jgi:ubiquinone/menaquinone biosynthesis C-methylase UbiE
MEKSRIVVLLALTSLGLVYGEEYHSITHRRIAGVMGAAGADWLTRPEREAEEHPDQALDAIGIEKGSTVADIGAGVGYYSWRLAQRVGPTGTVYGEDIQPEMLTKFRQNMAERKLTNVKAVLGAYDDPRLPKDTLDLVILVDVYHEFSEPEKMLQHIREAMKPGGRLVLLEYRAEDPTVPIRPEHEMTVKMVRAEVEPEGYKFDKTIEVLPWQHIIIFRR